jgi:hypothetical protein
MRTKPWVFKYAAVSFALVLTIVVAPQVYAEGKVEVGFCKASFNVSFLKSSSKTTMDKSSFPICFTASEHDYAAAYPKLGLSLSSAWTGDAIRDLEIKVDENVGANTYTAGYIDENSFGKIVKAKDDKGGYVELRVMKNAGNNIRIKCIDCRIVDVVKALNTLKEIQFINVSLLPKKKKVTFNFEAVSVHLIAIILSLEAGMDMAQYVDSEETRSEAGQVTFSESYAERYIFLEKSLKNNFSNSRN